MSCSASASAMTAALSRAQVPSSRQRQNRSYAVWYGPYRSGMSAHGDPVRFTQQIPLITCR